MADTANPMPAPRSRMGTMANDPINLRAPTLEERRAQERAQPTHPLRKLDWADGYELGARRERERLEPELTRLRAAVERLTRERDGAFERTKEHCANIALAINSGRGNEKEIAAAIRALENPNA